MRIFRVSWSPSRQKREVKIDPAHGPLDLSCSKGILTKDRLSSVACCHDVRREDEVVPSIPAFPRFRQSVFGISISPAVISVIVNGGGRAQEALSKSDVIEVEMRIQIGVECFYAVLKIIPSCQSK